MLRFDIILVRHLIKTIMEKNNYLPILKWRATEITALKNVSDQDKGKILPLIEIVLPGISLFKTVVREGKKEMVRKLDEDVHAEMVSKYKNERISRIPKEIEECRGKLPVLLDFSLLHDGAETINLKIESIRKVSQLCSEDNLDVRLVLNLNDDGKITDEIVNQFKLGKIKGLCIRITVSNQSDPLSNPTDLNKKLSDFIERTKISEENIDLVIDLKYLDDQMKASYKKIFTTSQSIYNLKKWRSFTFASGSFPIDVSKHKVDDLGSEPRFDWILWSDEVSQKGLVRTPAFGDYTIRNPIHSDALVFLQSSATLKYTLNEEWKIFRGQKQKNEQYLGHANLLVNESYFSGENFSFGDKYIFEKAKHFHVYMKDNKVKGMGRSGDWIAAGISHHLALVLSQLASQS